jgi:putative ABC transport system substrate-binding protein
MTGVNFLSAELAAKRLELLREMRPKARRVAVLVNPADARRTEVTLQDLEPAARTMGVQMQVLNANTANEIDAAFETISREQPDALFVAPTPFLNVRLVQLAQLTAFHRLPSTHDVREYAEVGGLMSYGIQHR